MLTRGKMERGVVEIVDMESLVPKEHLLRKIDAAVNWEQVYVAARRRRYCFYPMGGDKWHFLRNRKAWKGFSKKMRILMISDVKKDMPVFPRTKHDNYQILFICIYAQVLVQ